MADESDVAEKIRLKRLAKLSARADNVSPPSDPTNPVIPVEPKVVKPVVKLDAAGSSSKSSRAPSSTSKTNGSSPRPHIPSSAPNQPYQKWEDKQVGEILSVTLSSQEAEASNRRLCWLKDLAVELESEGIPLIISMDVVDRLLIARLSIDPRVLSDDPDHLAVVAGLPPDETVFEYLIGCWRRMYMANRDFNRLNYGSSDKAKWLESFARMKGLIMSYAGMTLEDPTMFPQPERPVGPAELLPILLAEPGSTSLGPDDLQRFLQDLDPDNIKDVITPTLSLFFQQWFSVSPSPDILGDAWRQYLGAMSSLAQVKSIAAVLPFLDIWIAAEVSAENIEWHSLLGPLIRLSVYPREFPQIWKTYFSDPTDRKVDDLNANKSNLRHNLAHLHNNLFTIFNAMVRSSSDARDTVLDFFAQTVRLNEKRAGMRADIRAVASDGFMTNLQYILLKLFEPAVDFSFSKLEKVDVDYFRRHPRFQIADDTKIRATKEDADAFFAETPAPATASNAFISDLFYMLHAFQQRGLGKTISTRIRAEKNIGEMEKELKRVEASRADWVNNPALQAQGEATIKKLKSDIAVLHASIHAYDTQLLDPAFIRLDLAFLSFTMSWLIRLVDPRHQHPAPIISLPLPDVAPLTFRMLPEYMFENIVDYFDFLTRYDPEVLENPEKDVLISFAITFMSPGYVNNPFLKAKLVSAIANGLHPLGHYRKGILYDRLILHSLAAQHLMPLLIRFFIEVESTGGHTQFWDKFNFRRDMSRIFRVMWDNPLFRAAFVQSRHDDFDGFVKFVNMLMSDMTFHLEESLTSLSKINSIQSQKADSAGWEGLPDNERQDLDAQLRQAESQAPFHTAMGLDHVELIRDFTATTKEPFVTAEIVDRLVATLDENLVNLVGPKMQELRVADQDRFAFKPKRLLAGIAQIYLNLGQETDFIRAVANDGRSYSRELFERFARILKHRAIMTETEVAEVVAFTQRVEDMKATIMMEDEREIPDEFLDPLLSTLMKDPVILPVSRVVIDRGTIRTVLLSKDVDPFNNMPLKLEDCIPDTELKARIVKWVAEGSTAPPRDVMEVDEL